jgi:metal-responsive CopG/Arc/MetJ family transcriptional regulator
MKTIQMTINPDLLDDVDAVVNELGTNRSAFMRHALQMALREHVIHKQEARHAAGYARHPIQAGEFDGWEDEQIDES